MPRSEAFVWIYLPGATAPTLAARLRIEDGFGDFRYAKSYLARRDAVELDPIETPLIADVLRVANDRNGGLPGVLRDASPDHWGRYVLGAHRDDGLSEPDLLVSGPDDRVGALSFSDKMTALPFREPLTGFSTLDDLIGVAQAAERQRNDAAAPPSEDLSRRSLALAGYAQTSLGGARPKATVRHRDKLWLAKVSRPEDTFSHPRTEAAMLDLAAACGIDAPKVEVAKVRTGIDALLIPRFDRVLVGEAYERLRFTSALTLLRSDELERGRWSYPILADVLRRVAQRGSGQELFKRIVFNALTSNGDDHPRNHGLIAVGGRWKLTPVYDLVPIPSHSHDVRLAMSIGDGGPIASVANLVSQAPRFGLSQDDAKEVISRTASIVGARWEQALTNRGVNAQQRRYLANAFLRPGLGLEPPTNDDAGESRDRPRRNTAPATKTTPGRAKARPPGKKSKGHGGHER